MIKTEALCFAYPAEEGEQPVRALQGVDIEIEKGSFVVVLGHNGSGKSTLAKTLNAVLLPEGGKVAILTGVLGAPNLEERIRGFQENVEGTAIEVMPVQTGDDDVQKSVDVVSQYTAANPDLAAWFFDGGWPYFADPDALPEVKAFMENGGHIISVDTCEPMLQYVGMGMVDLLIGQDYPKMGALGVETLYKIIKGEEVDLGDETHYIDTGYELVDINNYEEVWATKTPW